MTAAETGSYAFANGRARQRLTALEESLDAGTVRQMTMAPWGRRPLRLASP